MDPTSEQRGWTVFRLPRSHWHCHLWNFDWASVTPKKLQEVVRSFVEAVDAGNAPHLLMTGTPGIGKSHIGVGIYRALSTTLGTQRTTWINVPSFCEQVKRSYGQEVDPWQDIEDARSLVVLDDLFARELSAHEKDQIITRLLDTAYQNNAAVVCTMNPAYEELAHRLPAHEISRLLANSQIIPMTSTKDFRR